MLSTIDQLCACEPCLQADLKITKLPGLVKRSEFASCLLPTATKSAPDPGQQQGEEDSDGVSGSTLAAILIPIIIVAILVTAAVIVVVGVVVYFRNRLANHRVQQTPAHFLSPTCFRNKSSRLDETPIVPAGDSEVVAENEFADAKLDLESSDL